MPLIVPYKPVVPKRIPTDELDAVLRVVDRFPQGVSIEGIMATLEFRLPHRTLQRRLALLVEQKRLTVEGGGRGSRYRVAGVTKEGIPPAGNRRETPGCNRPDGGFEPARERLV